MIFGYDYIKPKYGERWKLCYTDTDSFVIYIKTNDFADDAERFDTSNYEEYDKRPLPIGMNKKEIGIFKEKLGGKIMKGICGLRAKTYAYLMDDDSEKTKAKGTKKKSVTKRRLMFENYKNGLFNDKTILQLQQIFKSDHHEVYTEEVNKIVLSSNDNKRLQTFDRITTYSHGVSAFKVCQSEILVITDYYKHDNEYEIMFGISKQKANKN